MKITQIRNATIIVNFNNMTFLVDPWLAPKDSMPGFDSAINSQIRQPRVELPCKINEIPRTDAVIVTHIHPDHWDEYAEDYLNKETQIFVQSDIDREYLNSIGFINVEVLSDEGTEFKGISLYKTYCQHGKRETIKPICEQIGMPYDSMGIVFKSKGEKTLYIAGDTIWCEEVENALHKYNPDVVVVNACGATVLSGERIIMNIEDVDKVIKNTNNTTTIIASHMDTVSHLTVTREDLKEYTKSNHITNLLIPADGETIEIK